MARRTICRSAILQMADIIIPILALSLKYLKYQRMIHLQQVRTLLLRIQLWEMI